MNMSIEKKIILYFCSALIILLFFIGVVVLPLINKIKDASQEYLANQETLIRLAQRESLSLELEKHFLEYEDDIISIEGAFLDTEEEIVGLILTLENIAQEFGNIFEIKSAIPSGVLVQDQTEEPFLSLQISIQGSFSNVLRFMASLEDNPYPPYRLMEIDTLSIKRLTGRSLAVLGEGLEEGDLEAILQIKIYTQ